MSQGARVAILLHVVVAVATAAAYLVLRPPPPPRAAGLRGPMALLGAWAYWATRPAVSLARAARLSATAMTILGTALSLGAGVAAAAGAFGWAALLLVWGSACDLLDGELARATGTQSRAGAFLDSSLDRLSEIALFAGLAVWFPDRSGPLWAFGAAAASLMVSYARARGEGLGVACPPFGLERPHRIVPFMVALAVAPFLREPTTARILEGLCAVVAVGAGATAVGRIVVIHQLLRRGAEEGRATDARPQAPAA
jgi:CDP-diacylglycerol--glycerol-3-phosphate 3-phosphatidyltransferase